MRFIAKIIEKLQRHPKRVVFPEGTEPRVLQAARQFYSLRLGAPVLLGDRTQVKQAAAELNVSLEGVRIINPVESEDLPAFIKRFELLRRYKGGVEEKEAREDDAQPQLLRRHDARHASGRWLSSPVPIKAPAAFLRPLFKSSKSPQEATTASSCMVMEVEDTRFGQEGVLFMGDCGVIPEPTVRNWPTSPFPRPNCAINYLASVRAWPSLSYSTKGSATHPSIGKVQAATALAQKIAHDTKGRGGFRRRTCRWTRRWSPKSRPRKLPESQVAGRANVLIFPDLNAGNIGSKLIQHVAKAHAYGQILLGIGSPQRGCLPRFQRP
jgi:phosphate acetyltransferase